MSAPGEYLKNQRELRGITLTDVSNSIKVPIKLLKALEADNYDPLPHPTFVKGFIKAYCKYLGIDENDAVLRYEMFLQEMADFDEHATKVEEEKARKSAFFAKPLNVTLSLVALGVAAVIVFFFAFRPSGDSSKTADVATTNPQAIATPEPAAPGTVAVPASVTTDVQPKVMEVKAPEVSIMAGPEAVRERVLPPQAEAPLKPIEQTKPAQPAEPAKPASDAPPSHRRDASNGTGRGHELTASATELTWMQVTMDDKAPVELLMRPSESATWRADRVFF
jgi:cytoskeleton protein RodZ